MDIKPPTGKWGPGKDGALEWDGEEWKLDRKPEGDFRSLHQWIRSMHTWGQLVAIKTRELEDRIEKLETELKNMRRTVT